MARPGARHRLGRGKQGLLSCRFPGDLSGGQELRPLLRFGCALGLLALPGHFCIDTGRAQNIVDRSTVTLSANPEKLTEKEVSEFIFKSPDFRSTLQHPEARRLAGKLEAHV